MKRALITGASGDIGTAICRRPAATGMPVIAHANRSSQSAEALVTFPVSEQADDMSGQVIGINGGMI